MSCVTKDGRALPHDALEQLRLRAAAEFAKNTPVERICAMVGMSQSAVFGWKRQWRAGGEGALAAKPVPGRPGKLTDAQLRELAFMVRNHTPADYGLTFALWTRELIGDLIERQFGHRFQPDWVGKVMRRIGFSPQRPVYRASRQDPEKVREWRERAHPAIKKEAAQVGATVYFGDEAHLRQDFHAGTTWAPLGETPVVESSAKRESVSMISAIEPRGSIHFSAFTGTCDAERFIEFCTRMLEDDGGTVFLIVDNSPVHHSITVREHVKSTGGRLRLFFLPPYSPTLNPDEWVWKNVKNDRAGRQAAKRPGDLYNFACRALDRLAGKPGLVRGFFGDRHLAYIA